MNNIERVELGLTKIEIHLIHTLDTADAPEFVLRDSDKTPEEVKNEITTIIEDTRTHIQNEEYKQARDTFCDLMNKRAQLEKFNTDFSWGTDSVMDTWYMEVNSILTNQIN